MEALVWIGVAFAAMCGTLATVRGVSELQGKRRYARTLANIARLDRELGLGEYHDLAFAADTAELEREIADAYRATVAAAPTVPVEAWILGYCTGCSQRVALNTGRCSGFWPGACAKVEWERRTR